MSTLHTPVQCPFPESSIVLDKKKVQKQDLKTIKNVKRCRDGMAKITVQSLLRDIGWLVVRSTGCVVVLQVSLHFTVKVTCSSVWLCCIGSLPPESNEIYSTLMLRKATKVNCVCPRF